MDLYLIGVQIFDITDVKQNLFLCFDSQLRLNRLLGAETR